MILAGGYLVLVRPRPTQPGEPFTRSPRLSRPTPAVKPGPACRPTEPCRLLLEWTQEDNHDVYIKLVGSGEPVRLTTAPERGRKPGVVARRTADCVRAALPRAYVRGLRDASPGGAERRVASFVLDSSRRPTRLSWSPDGKWVVIGGKASASEPFGLWLVEIDGTETRRLTTRRARSGRRTSAPSSRPTGAASRSSEARRPTTPSSSCPCRQPWHPPVSPCRS